MISTRGGDIKNCDFFDGKTRTIASEIATDRLGRRNAMSDTGR
jgi:hypothetical protein